MSDPPHLLVIGEQRSGTTLLAGLLSEQPGVRLVTGYLDTVLWRASTLGLLADAPLGPRERQVLHGALRQSRRVVGLEGRPGFGADDVETVAGAYAAALADLARPGDRLVGHKIHRPAEYLPELLRCADVRVVALVRDVRDVVLSRSRRGEDALDGPVESWRRAVRTYRSLEGEPRFLRIRFEDLVRRPAEVIERLGTFLGLSIAHDHRHLSTPLPGWVENSSFDDVRGLFDPAAAERWRKHAREEAVVFAAWACRQELEALGYEVPRTWTRRQAIGFGRRRATLALLEHAGRLRRALRRLVLPPFAS